MSLYEILSMFLDGFWITHYGLLDVFFYNNIFTLTFLSGMSIRRYFGYCLIIYYWVIILLLHFYIRAECYNKYAWKCMNEIWKTLAYL